MKKMFQHSPNQLAHISVGAVVVNEKGEILAHKLERARSPEKFDMGGLTEAYILMRESLENNETLEAAVLRGVREEFAIEGEITRYLGSLTIAVPEVGYSFQKTTLYFEVRCLSRGERNPEDEEAFTTLEWVEPRLLFAKMQEQGLRGTRTDCDESSIVARYLQQV